MFYTICLAFQPGKREPRRSLNSSRETLVRLSNCHCLNEVLTALYAPEMPIHPFCQALLLNWPAMSGLVAQQLGDSRRFSATLNWPDSPFPTMDKWNRRPSMHEIHALRTRVCYLARTLPNRLRQVTEMRRPDPSMCIHIKLCRQDGPLH